MELGAKNTTAITLESTGNLQIPISVFGYDGTKFQIIGVGSSAFSGTNIDGITLPEGIEYVNTDAFKNCTCLKTITIPKSAKRIDDNFSGCSSIKDIYVNWRKPEDILISTAAFDDISLEAVLHVPAGTRTRYFQHPVWGKFSQIIENGPISISDITTIFGTRPKLSVNIDSPDNIMGLQFKLTLPKGCTLEKDNNIVNVSTTDRTTGMTIMGCKDPDSENSYLFILFGLEGRAISGNEGAILDIPLTLDSNMDLGTYGITIEDVHLATASLETLHPAESASELTIKDYTLGDVNSDGKISIFDAVQVVNYILGSNPSGFVEAAADMDGNERITIFDAVSIVNVILSQGN